MFRPASSGRFRATTAIPYDAEGMSAIRSGSALTRRPKRSRARSQSVKNAVLGNGVGESFWRIPSIPASATERGRGPR